MNQLDSKTSCSRFSSRGCLLRFSFLAIASSVLMASCAAAPSPVQPAPRYSEAKKEDVRKLIEQNPAQAIPVIAALRGTKAFASDTELDDLYGRSVSLMEGMFHESLNGKDFTQALQTFGSLSALKSQAEGDWSTTTLLVAAAEKSFQAGDHVVAFLYFLKAIESGRVDDKTVALYLDRAYADRNRAMSRSIAAYALAHSVPVSDEIKAFEETKTDTTEMMKGAVTIWVNRGMRITNGVGVPDRVIGSGFFIDGRGYLLTNYHVIQSEVDPKYEGYSRLFIRTPDMKDDRIPAKVIGWDKSFDLALLKTEAVPGFVFSFTGRDSFRPGDRIYAIGSPVGLENTVTSGIVSALARPFLEMGDAVQVDAPLNPGNSGGPLLDSDGQLVGIVFAGIEQYSGLNFAISSKYVMELLPRLFAGGEVKHPWIGAMFSEDKGAVSVQYVIPGSPAYGLGLQQDDVVTAIDGKPVATVRQLQDYLLSCSSDRIISLAIRRTGASLNVLVALGERPELPMASATDRDSSGNLLVPFFGMSVTATTSNIFEHSYRIDRIYKGSSADEAGLSENDPFSLQSWQVDKKAKAVILQIVVKKKKDGFLESILQLVAPLEMDNLA
jgi:serine protease Do